MQNMNVFFGIVYILIGIVFILISIPLVTKKVPMNKLYGFRISKSLESNENWYKINHYGGKQLVQWSIPLILIGILYFIFPIQELQDIRLNVFLAIAPIPICIAAAIAKTLLFSKQL